MILDVRSKPADAATSIVASPKAVDVSGHTSLVVPDDSHAGAAAVVVLLGPDGAVLAQQVTVVGENS